MLVESAKRNTRWWAVRMPLSWYRNLTLFNAIAIWGLIVLGGMVRVTESGRGCGSDWPMCNGHLFPSLEYHELVEWNHRLFGVLVGLLMMVTVISTLIWFRRPRRLLVFAGLAAFTYIAQALLGGITVLLNLDHTWVAAHMGNSMLLLGSVTLLAVFARLGPVPMLEQNRWLKWLALGTLIWTFIALFTGSAVIGANAELACKSWPDCAPNQLLPATIQQWVSFGHRLAVGASDVLLLTLAIVIWRTRRSNRRLMNTTHFMAVLYISQVFLGAFTIWLGAPEWIKGAHLALAAATWAALVIMTTFIWLGQAPAREPSNEDSDGDGGNAGNANSVRLTRRIAQAVPIPETVKLYISLMRLNVVPLLLVPMIAAMLIAATQHTPQRNLLELLLWATIGGVLATGGAHTINQYLDRDIDAHMKRTRRRPIVTGAIAPNHALTFGIVISAAGVGIMAVAINPLAALLSLSGNLFYVFVYTAWLKRTSTQNIVIGGAAGAVPPLVGWAAVTGDVGLPAVLFFAIIFFWTPAHFWALALVRNEEYTAAGVPMLPVVRGEDFTRSSIMKYTVLMVGVTLVPFLLNALGWLYVVVAAVLGYQFLRKAMLLQTNHSTAQAWKLFKFSNTYLAALYLVMVLDRLIVLVGS